MATSLPQFERFSVYSDEQNVGTRWRKWISKFENLLCALDIKSDPRKKAMLLHYGGDDLYTITESFSDEKLGIGHTTVVNGIRVPDEYTKLKQSLTEHFTPKTNTAYEVLKFRASKQGPSESLDSFHTRLRTLSINCDFPNVDSEIVTQIIQGCNSHRLRRRALREGYTLEQILSAARAQELSESRATEIESNNTSVPARTQAEASANSVRPKKPPQRKHNNSNQDRKPISKKCHFCGGRFPHDGKCPAFGKECRSCGKMNHFSKVCRSKGTSSKPKQHVAKRVIEEDKNDSSSESDESVFCLPSVSKNSKTPVVMTHILDKKVSFLIDSGASVNIMHNNVFKRMKNQKLTNPCPVIKAFGTQNPLPVKGFFFADITYKSRTTNAKIYVVDTEKETENLMSAETAIQLKLIHFAFAAGIEKNQIADQYPKLFDGKLGKIKNVEIKLHVNKEVIPVSQPHRRVPFHMRKQIESELNSLEKADIIEKVVGPTPWVSPIVCVPKKQKDQVRICVDMREPNKAIGRERHPMPTLDDLITDLNGATMFSKLDMTQAYHQLELDESSRHMTTFTTHVGLRRYKRLLFGVNAASEIFQNTIANLLQDIPGSKNLSDDIIVYGKSKEEHDKNLHATLKRLEESGAKLNKQKCVFASDSLTFFGHVFGKNGISADPDKINSIMNAPAPTNIAELRSFLGMTQYLSRFIDGYASKTEPLRSLLKKDTRWSWGNSQQKAFQSLKDILTSTCVMAYFNPNEETHLLVDASPVGLGAILTQGGKVVCYASRALTEVEKRYSQTDREMLAVVYGVEHFHIYVHGAPFTVSTDHKPLLGIMKSRNPSTARIERYRLRLMPYEMNLVYRPGKDENNPADYMSRHPQTQPKRENKGEEYIAFLTKHAIPKSLTLTEVQEATKKDIQLQCVMKAIQTGVWTDDLSEFKRFRDELSVFDGLILRAHRLVIPNELRRRVINIAHQSHQGIVKTKQLLREKVWFPGIDKLVEATVKSCIPCQASYQGQQRREPLMPTPLPSSPWTCLSMDFAGPFPSGDYLMIVIDDYSRYPEVEIIKSVSEKTVLPKLDQIFARQGLPKEIKSDNGPPFNGKAFADYADECGFKHRKITPLWPEANGSAERAVQTVKNAIRAFVAEGADWKEKLPTFLRSYRATPHSATGISPFEALTGRKMRIGIPESPKLPSHTNKTPSHTKIQNNDFLSKSKMTDYANTHRHTQPCKITPGDQVLVKQQKQNSLTTPFSTVPLLVKERKGSMITAERPDGSKITRNSSHFKALPPSFQPNIEHPSDYNEDYSEILDDPDTEQPLDDPDIEQPHPPDLAPPVRRSERQRRPPAYLKNYNTK